MQNEFALFRQDFLGRDFATRIVITLVSLLTFAVSISATPLNEYQRQVRQAVTALGTLGQADEFEADAAYQRRRAETVASLRVLLPERETVEWNETKFEVDNSWFHEELSRYEKAQPAAREDLLKGTAERLEAISERLAELEKPGTRSDVNKAEAKRKLDEILQRSEYGPTVDRGSALPRVTSRFFRWLRSFIPKSSRMPAGAARVIGRAAEIFVIALAVAILAFVLKLFLPRFLRAQRTKKKDRTEARIVLGETLNPDQTAHDLLAEAELLARRGELRAAIRKGYIALLVELGDRKVISLAQHKTNRDYLSALRELPPLHRNVEQLTNSFERHWYGLIPPDETDWQNFRSSYRQALSR